MRIAQTAVLIAILAGCASTPPARFYTLDMTPSGNAKVACNIEVDRLRVHEALSRTDILIMKSPTEIEYYAAHQWAASLPELVGEKLRAEFGNPVEDRPTVFVGGKVLAFAQVDAESGDEALVKLEVDYRTPDMDPYDAAALTQTYEARIPVKGAGINGLVVALSEGLESVAGKIAADANRLAAENS